MHYQILPGKGDAKVVNIGDGETVFLKIDAPDLEAAHALLRRANAEGWESLTQPQAPVDPAPVDPAPEPTPEPIPAEPEVLAEPDAEATE